MTAALGDIQQALLDDIYNGTQNSAQYLHAGGPDTVNYRERLDIYYNNTLLTLIENLEHSYPVLVKIVGEDFFKSVARSYIKSYPLKSANVTTFGAQLSKFIKNVEAAQHLLYLSDVASLEWAYAQSNIAEDAQAMDFENLQRCMAENENFILELHPSVSLHSFEFNAIELWQAHQSAEIDALQVIEKRHQVLVWRNTDDNVNFKKISLPMYALLKSCQQQQTFSQAMNAAMQIAEQHKFELAEFEKKFQQEFGQLVTYAVFSLGLAEK